MGEQRPQLVAKRAKRELVLALALALALVLVLVLEHSSRSYCRGRVQKAGILGA